MTSKSRDEIAATLAREVQRSRNQARLRCLPCFEVEEALPDRMAELLRELNRKERG